MAQAAPESLLSVAQAAALLGVHANTIRSWTDAGRLTAYRINARGDRRFRHDDVMRLLVEDGGPTVPAVPGTAPGRADLKIFGRIANGLAATPTAASVARTLVEAFRTEMTASRVAVYVASDDRLHLAAHGGFAAPPPATRDLEATADASDASDASDREVAIRLATRRGITGLLLLDVETAQGMSPVLRDSLVATASTALASARLLGRARSELLRARALTAVARDLAGELDLARVLDDIIERTRTLFGADRAGLWEFDDTAHPIVLATSNLSDEFLARSAARGPLRGGRSSGRADSQQQQHRQPGQGEQALACAAHRPL